MFVYWLANPLSVWVASDSLVEGVDEDDVKVLVRGILSNPVAVQHAQGTALPANTFLLGKKIICTTEVNSQNKKIFFIKKILF